MRPEDAPLSASIGILLVDDVEPWRRLITSMFQKSPDLQIIGEVSDGLQAVQKAQELQPDLILLDIGLPKLNGIEAAQRIQQISPKSKILFLSQESSRDVVQGALSTGASGYVVKSDASRELLPAINAILRGEKFVGIRFRDLDLAGALDARAADARRRNSIYASLPQPNREIARRHEAGFYSDDACFLDSFVQFIGSALKAGSAAIVVATESHRESILPRLQVYDADVGAAVEQGRYISVDAAETLSTFMVGGLPDPVRFLEIAGDLITTAAKTVKGENARIVACGECAPLLWSQGNAEAAIQVERLWDEIAISGVDILCGYSLRSFQGGTGSYIFDKLCTQHSAVHSR